MGNIRHLADFELTEYASGENAREKSKVVNKIFDGARRQIISVELYNGEVLAKHKANEPITVLCLSGSGTFSAGADLSESQKLEAGTLITLEAGIEHEVAAEPEIRILVTKFKAE